MKNLKRGRKRVKKQEKVRTAGAVFMSMGLPAHIVKSVNRQVRKAS
jgi:hypothetical protein